LGAIKHTVVDVKLDGVGYPGEVLYLWMNFPQPVLEELMKLQGENVIQQFILDNGILCGSTFTLDDGTPFPLKDLPWDVSGMARKSVIEAFTKMANAIAEYKME